MSADASHNNPEVFAEDHVRAEVYGLLSYLFYQPPEQKLLDWIASGSALCNDAVDSQYSRSWRALQQAARIDAPTVRDEFDTAFIGTGRQPVMLYGSFYIAGYLHEKPLANLRDELTKLGVARRNDRHESEDHISALCDVMRWLIEGDAETTPATLGVQRDFFRGQIEPWHAALCDAIVAANQTSFYKRVAELMRTFFALEVESLDMP